MAKPFVTGYQGFFNPGLSVAISQGAQLSNVINCGGMALVGVILPSVFTGTALSFEIGDDEDGYQATGQIVVSGTTSNNDTITINGVVTTFKTVVTDATTQVEIKGTAALTAAALYAFLIASETAGLLDLTYSYVAAGTCIMVTAIVHGTDGNAYTFAKSSGDITLTPSGGTLTGGGFRALYDSSNAVISYTVAQGRSYAIDPKNFQGIPFLKLKSGSAELAPRTIVCTLKGL